MVLPVPVLVKQRAEQQFPAAQHPSGHRGWVSPALPCVGVVGSSRHLCPLLTPQHWSHTSPCCCRIYFRLTRKLSFSITSAFGVFNSLPMREG